MDGPGLVGPAGHRIIYPGVIAPLSKCSEAISASFSGADGGWSSEGEQAVYGLRVNRVAFLCCLGNNEEKREVGLVITVS